MNLYIKQHVFTWGDRFSIYDEAENECYYVEGEVFTWGKKLHLYDLRGTELAFIRQEVMSFLPRFCIYKNGLQIAEVVKEFAFFHQAYTVEGLGWTVEGDFWSHDYEIRNGDEVIASVSKEWFTWGDVYQLSFAPGVDVTSALAVVLVIDACLEQAANASN